MTNIERVKNVSVFGIERGKLRIGLNRMNAHEQQFSRIGATLNPVVYGVPLKLEGRNLRTGTLCRNTTLPSS